MLASIECTPVFLSLICTKVKIKIKSNKYTLTSKKISCKVLVSVQGGHFSTRVTLRVLLLKLVGLTVTKPQYLVMAQAISK